MAAMRCHPAPEFILNKVEGKGCVGFVILSLPKNELAEEYRLRQVQPDATFLMNRSNY